MSAADFTPGARITGRARTITESDIVSFAAMTGDWHPQHVDAEWAAESRFGERIAHGMLVLSYSIGLMGFDPERVVALRGIDSLTFKRPVPSARRSASRQRSRTCVRSTTTTSWSSSAGKVFGDDDNLALRARVTIVHRHEGASRHRCQARCQAPLMTVTGVVPRSNGASESLYGERVLL